MKKIITLLVALLLVVSMTACGSSDDSDSDNTDDDVEESVDINAKSEGVMTYAEYVEAELDTEVVIETYVQAKQSWWDDTATLYTQDGDGAYFIYNMAISEEDYDSLTVGTKIKVTGYKSEWAGEVEIIDATFEVETDATYVAEATDVTSLLGTDELEDYMNQFVTFTDVTIAASTDADGNEVAFLYSWDGSGSHDENSDLYFNVEYNGEVYSFTVESYLTGNDTDVYAAVEALEVGDVVTLEGFLYWYNGVNPHITSVTVSE